MKAIIPPRAPELENVCRPRTELTVSNQMMVINLMMREISRSRG